MRFWRIYYLFIIKLNNITEAAKDENHFIFLTFNFTLCNLFNTKIMLLSISKQNLTELIANGRRDTGLKTLNIALQTKKELS